MHTMRELREEEWPIIRQFLPPDLDAGARQFGAMRRQRGSVSSAEDLLRLLLMHIAGGLSLEQTVVRARIQGLPTLNAMALHKRLCNSERWLAALTTHLVDGIRPLLKENEDCWKHGRRVRLLDATDVQETGATGSKWRLHYSVRLPELCCDFFALTDVHVAESLRNLPVEKGDLVLVDRGYNDRRAVGRVVAQGADVILRYNSGALPLLDSKGRPFDPLPHLRPLKIGQTREWAVQFNDGARLLSARLCALRKSPAQAQRARSKVLRKARGNSAKVRDSTLEYTNYVIVITTVSAAELNLAEVLEFYRARWQVELAFKRLKTLLQLGQLPKKKESSCRAWMQGKILSALLIERMLCEARFFSPWGYRL
jgi:hypothetical protein